MQSVSKAWYAFAVMPVLAYIYGFPMCVHIGF